MCKVIYKSCSFYINSLFFFTTLNLHDMRLQGWDSVKICFLMLEKLHDAYMFCILQT